MNKRRQTSQIYVGNVGVGSDYPVSVQSMTTTKTKETDDTLGQIYELANRPKYSYFTKYDNHMMEYDEDLIFALESFLKSLN